MERIENLNCCERKCPRVAADLSAVSDYRSRISALIERSAQPIGFDQLNEDNLTEALANLDALIEMKKRLFQMLTEVGVEYEEAESAVEEIAADLKSVPDLESAKSVAKKWCLIFKERNYSKRIDVLLMDRNVWVAKLISEYLQPGSVLDHDSGDSHVAKFISQNRPDVDVHTEDSYDCRSHLDLKFRTYKYEDKTLEYQDGSFDQAILATVLHHCDDPELMFEEVSRVVKPGGRLILLENVYPSGDAKERLLNIIFDWFFNAVLHETPLPLPFQHLCPEEWEYFFEKKGLKIVEKVELGHHVAIPLDHILYVVEKK